MENGTRCSVFLRQVVVPKTFKAIFSMPPRMTEIDRLVIRGLQENPLLEKEVCVFILIYQIGGFKSNLSLSYFILLVQRRD